MLKRKTIRNLLTASAVAGVSACAQPGDFCDVWPGPLRFERETAAQMVETDRAAVIIIDTLNRYGATRCPGATRSR